MGFFDTVKEKANALASDAGRASKVTAAQARVVVLQNEVRKAERELGHATFDLVESGKLGHAGIAASAARLRDAHRALSEKEAEIAAIRAGAGDPQAAGAAAQVVEPPAPAEGPAPKTEAGTAGPEARADAAGGAGPSEPAENGSAGKAAADEGAAGTLAAPKPAAKTSAKKAAPGKMAGKTGSKAAAKAPPGKAPAKKPAGSKAPARKPSTSSGTAAKKPPASST